MEYPHNRHEEKTEISATYMIDFDGPDDEAVAEALLTSVALFPVSTVYIYEDGDDDEVCFPGTLGVNFTLISFVGFTGSEVCIGVDVGVGGTGV